MNWHNLNIEKVLELTGSSLQGLTNPEVEKKRLVSGRNLLKAKKKKPAWRMFLSQFTDFMILVLLSAAVISGIIGDITDTIIILIIVLLNAVLGFVQEYRAEKSLEMLKKMAAPNATVIRENQIRNIGADELVPGDIVLLESGNIVPADLRLTETHNLQTDESSLTGESLPVEKITGTLEDKDLPPGDRLNMAFKSTLIAAGRATGIVVATGMETEIGKIAELLDQKETQTPLQLRMTDFSKKLSYIILLICAFIFGIGISHGEDTFHMLLLSISLAVAAIPEALPALITIALARGAKRMVKGKALIRKLYAVETLGSITFICSDKTGTLTQNKMKVVSVHENENVSETINDLSIFELSIALSHDVRYNENNLWEGDPTEVALVEYFAEKYTANDLLGSQDNFKRVAELPFDSDRKCMTTVHAFENKFLIISKGAAESIAEILSSAEEQSLILNKAEELAQQGARIIVYAYRILDEIPSPFNYESAERDLIYSGMAGMVDPPRPEVKNSINECRNAGIQPVMITGDHPATASAIAKEIGILKPGHLVVTGKELKALTAESFDEKVENIRVYARVSPDQKLNIVKALQRKNHFVGMTGDGVNDAPSLKAANIGIAMGITGSDVSKEAAHMILLDDNFATIVNAIREGRRIYDNIRKFVKYIMTCNSAEILTISLAPLLGLPMPLLPIHILWINLVTDGLPGLALASERPEKNIMQRPPRNTQENIFSGGIGYHIIWVGLLMAAVTIGAQAWAIHEENSNWQTIVFTVLTFAQLGHVLAIRSDRLFLLKQGIFSNLYILGAVFLTFVIQMMIIYLPFANAIFHTHPLSMRELIICILIASVVFHAVELEKWIRSKLN